MVTHIMDKNKAKKGPSTSQDGGGFALYRMTEVGEGRSRTCESLGKEQSSSGKEPNMGKCLPHAKLFAHIILFYSHTTTLQGRCYPQFITGFRKDQQLSM